MTWRCTHSRTVLVAAQLGEPRRFAPEELAALLAIKKRLGIPAGRREGAPPTPER